MNLCDELTIRMLLERHGDTIRVSLAAEPEKEVEDPR